MKKLIIFFMMAVVAQNTKAASTFPCYPDDSSVCATSSSTQLHPCSLGNYCKATGSNPGGCSPCAAGKYGTDDCKSMSDCAGSCKAGYYCPTGSYSDDGGITMKNTACNNGICTCPVGKYCEAGATSDSDAKVKNCNGGYYCPGGAVNSSGGGNPTACTAKLIDGIQIATVVSNGCRCASGFYCKSDGSQNPFVCSVGHYCGPGSSNENAQCKAGFLCTRYSTTDEGKPRIGSYVVSSDNNQHYCSADNSCKCTAGYYCPKGTSAPLLCPAGSYCPEGCASPVICPGGYYCPAGTGGISGSPQNIAACNGVNGSCQCPNGFNTAGSGITEEGYCKRAGCTTAGTYWDGSGCVACTPGNSCKGMTTGILYSQSTTVQGIEPCTPNPIDITGSTGAGYTGASSTGPNDCPWSATCPKGSYISKSGKLASSASCTPCEIRNYCPNDTPVNQDSSDGYGMVPCDNIVNDANASYTSPGVIDSQCPWELACSPGTYYLYDSTTPKNSTCRQCEQGYYCLGATADENTSSNIGRDACANAPTNVNASYTSTGVDNPNCPWTGSCPPGDYFQVSSTSCKPCLEGHKCPGAIPVDSTVNADIGLNPCDVGEYQEKTGQATCSACPSGTWSAPGNPDIRNCYIPSDAASNVLFKDNNNNIGDLNTLFGIQEIKKDAVYDAHPVFVSDINRCYYNPACPANSAYSADLNVDSNGTVAGIVKSNCKCNAAFKVCSGACIASGASCP